MAIKTHKVTLSLDNPRVIQSGINVQSFDKQSIQISIELTKNDEVFQVPSDATIRISLLKLARQEQKIIVDVPNTNRDSIDWIVPDYLDGYQGTVRVGVYLVSGAENVDLGYFTIFSNVSDIDKMADEFTDNVFQGWEQIEADLNELNLTIAQTKLDLADDLTQIDNTIANINTLASDFTTDVATKQSDVTSKYNAFDTSVTQAGQTIDDILALQPQFQTVIDETTGKDVISAPEIILARDGATTLGERLDSDKAEVNAQLAQTMTKADTATLKADAMASGSPKGVYATLVALQSAFPTGTTGAYLVTADGKWYYWNGTAWTAGGTYQSTGIGKASVTPKNTTFIKLSQNLFNKATVKDGFANTTGTDSANASYGVSDYIEAEPSTQYTVTYANAYVATFYDANKVYLTNQAGSGANFTFMTPANAKYMKINIPKTFTNYDVYMVVEGAVLPTEYVPYSVVIDKSISIDGEQLKAGSVDALKLADGAFTLDKISGFTKSQNLFNKDTAKIGYANTTGTDVVSSRYVLSDFIPVKPSNAYTISWANVCFATFYDANKTYITNMLISDGLDSINHTFTTPSNTYYMKINITKSKINYYDFMVVEGEVMPSDYIPFMTTMDGINIYDDNLMSLKFLNKKVVTFGDSITWYDGQVYNEGNKENGTLVKGYQSYMRDKLRCLVENKGVSGYDMTQIWTSVISPYDFANADIITITSGANDHRKNVLPGIVLPIGSTFDTATYAGALQASIEKILNFNQEIKIYLFTPIKGWYNESGTSDVPGPYKGEMMLSVDYVNVMKDIGELYSVPVCDLYHLSTINQLTRPTLIGDLDTNPYYLHPSSKGYKRMADILIPFLENS